MDEEALGWAIFDGDAAAVHGLLSDGADPNAVDEDGVLPVSLAIWRGHEDVLRVLVEFGATLAIPSLLHDVVASQDLPGMLPVLLDLGLDVNARDPNGWTPLHFTSAYGFRKSVEVLLDAGADVAARTNVGLTAAEAARRNGYGDLSSILGG